MADLVIRDLSKSYGENAERHSVLSHLSHEFSLDACTVILGKSGCGKTTLLRLIAGLETPDEGTINWPPDHSFGMMFQEARLMPWLTCRQNVALGKREASGGRSIDELLKLVHLTDAADRYPHELSGGMQQRTALARTLAMNRRVILMDEPFAALDYFTRLRLQQELMDMKNQLHLGLILVTHNVEEALNLADTILVLENGNFIFEEVVPSSESKRDLLSPEFILLKRRLLDALQTDDSYKK
jgi:sulfonate transport system ATP-binding protein